MGMKNVILITPILVLFIISHVSNAEFLWNFRRLADNSPKQDLNVPPIPSPEGNDKSNHTSPPLTPGEKNPKEEHVKNITPPTIPPPTIPPPVIPPPALPPPTDANNNDTSTETKKADDKHPKEKEKGKKKPRESCDGIERRCQDEKSMVACVKSFEDASKEVVLLIQNTGVNSLNVDLAFPSSGDKQDVTEIPNIQNEQVNIPLAKVGGNEFSKVKVPLAKVEGNEIKLSAGNGYCVLHLGDLGAPTFQGNFYQWSAPYSKFMTPIYGAYLILLITLVAGGVCACCWFCKRKRTSEVPYQELEMSVPASATDMDNTEGWDEVWDDDWDEEKAVKSPGHSISANGLTTRTPKKDGWEDWDD